MGAMAATATLTVIAQILDTIPQVGVIHEYLYTHWWLAAGDLMRDPMLFDDIRTGLLTCRLPRGLRNPRLGPLHHQGRHVLRSVSGAGRPG